jgi:signal transduction histidine kinase
MLELIANSREMISDPANLRVTINIESGRPTQGWVTIAYADNGPGIPEELRERIFEGFFSHRPGRERSTGLGMWYVRRIVTAHGGTIRAEGQAGQGATFVIEIPVSGPSPPTKED